MRNNKNKKTVTFVKNPRAKEHNGKYTLKKTMDKKDQFVLSYALLANKMRSKPENKDLQTNAFFYEPVMESVPGQKKKRKTYIKTSLRRDKFKLHFSSSDELHAEALRVYPELMSEVVEETMYIPKKQAELDNLLALKGKKSYDRYILTCAVSNAKVNWNMVSSIKNYIQTMKEMGSNVICLVFAANSTYTEIDNFFHEDEDFMVLFEDVKVNANLHLNTIKVRAGQMNPVTSMERFAEKTNSSVIIGSPKQRLQTVWSAEGEVRFVASTGSVTLPNYISKKYGVSKGNTLATYMHEPGFILIEQDKQDLFHSRAIKCSSDGSFTDLGLHFGPLTPKAKNKHGEMVFDKSKLPKALKDRVTNIRPKYAYLADIHAYHIDPVIEKLTHEQLKFTEAEDVICGDSVDCSTASHHTLERIAETQALDLLGKKDLADELQASVDVLKRIVDIPTVNQVYETYSNHDDFITRALDSGKRNGIPNERNGLIMSLLHANAVLYKAKEHYECGSATNKDPKKIKTFGRKEAIEVLSKRFPKSFVDYLSNLNNDLLECKHPTQLALEMFGLEKNAVKFLSKNDILKVKDLHLQYHGTFYGNPSKSMRFVQGHTHSPGIFENKVVVGVCKTKAQYAAGSPTKWAAAHAFIYPDSNIQLVFMVKGEYRLQDKVYDKLKVLAKKK